MKSARCLHIWSPMHQIDRKKRLVTRATHRDFMFHQKWTLLLKSEPPLLGGHTERTNVLEIAVNSREFQRIVVLVLFLSSTFQTPFIGKIQIHQTFRTIDWSPFTQEIELTPKSYQKISTFESRPTSTIHFWDAIHRSSPRNQLAGTPSDLVLKSMTIADLPSFWPVRFTLFPYFYVFGDLRKLNSQVCFSANFALNLRLQLF